MSPQRLQKIIAAAGVASRRKAEALITAGRVSVNGSAVTELGAKADPGRDDIRVDGKPLRPPERRLYVLLNKPRGVVSTVSDPEGRTTVLDLVPRLRARLYPIGRLDYHSEGLLLLTNDGELAKRLMSAAHHVSKTYLVKVSGRPSEDAIEKLRRGIVIGDFAPVAGKRRMAPVKTAPAKVRLLRPAENPWYEVTLVEGRNRQLRRMFERIGHRVSKIKRIRYGPLELDVPPGHHRLLSSAEVARLRRISDL